MYADDLAHRLFLAADTIDIVTDSANSLATTVRHTARYLTADARLSFDVGYSPEWYEYGTPTLIAERAHNRSNDGIGISRADAAKVERIIQAALGGK